MFFSNSQMAKSSGKMMVLSFVPRGDGKDAPHGRAAKRDWATNTAGQARASQHWHSNFWL